MKENPENKKSQPRETTVNFLYGDKTMTIFTSDIKWINRIVKLANSYPEEVYITRTNEDGSITAELPVKYFKLSPPRKMSEENRLKAAERLRLARENSLYIADVF